MCIHSEIKGVCDYLSLASGHFSDDFDSGCAAAAAQ